MPTLNSHTHCQVAQAAPQAKTWQRVCLLQPATDRQSRRKKNTERTTGGFAKVAVQWLNSCSVFQINFSAGLTVLCSEIPHERQAQNR